MITYSQQFNRKVTSFEMMYSCRDKLKENMFLDVLATYPPPDNRPGLWQQNVYFLIDFSLALLS